MDFDLERLAVVRTSLIVKKRPNKLVIKRRVALVFRRLEDGLNVKCKCKVSREEVEAFAEEEMKVDVPPIEGKCKFSGGLFFPYTLSQEKINFPLMQNWKFPGVLRTSPSVFISFK